MLEKGQAEKRFLESGNLPNSDVLISRVASLGGGTITCEWPQGMNRGFHTQCVKIGLLQDFVKPQY